jgi:HAD domain in Swiss Army Knife RNA repair proteins
MEDQMTMILFLDFDGVMHPLKGTDLFCREEHLARALRDFPGVDVVISSSWRETHTLTNMLTFFLTDLRSRIVGVTPVIEIRNGVDVPGVRWREINQYLSDTGNEHRPWVALDDDPGNFPAECAELILCDSNHGFGNAAEKALRAALANNGKGNMSCKQADELWREIERAVRFDDGLAAKSHLAAGRAIYYGDPQYPGQIVKEYPDGRRQLVNIDEKGVITVIKEI